MGKIKQGINGPFTGKVGSVVGIDYNGVGIMRSLPSRRSKPFTPQELQQQAKFRLTSQFLKPLRQLLNRTFTPIVTRTSGYRKAFSYNIKNAITGLQPNLSIDFSMLSLGRGDLPNAGHPSARSSGEGKVAFSWIDNTGKGMALASDKAYVAAYCEELQHWIFETEVAVRSAATCLLDASRFIGKSLQTYIGFMAEDGKETSESAYTGLVSL